ncbi:Exodeoxyribonuclease [compost metagenome]
MTTLLRNGFIDTFRYLYPERENMYSWWSYMPKIRERNVGWRIDYFLISSRLGTSLQEAEIDCHIMGSDHCPVSVTLAIPLGIPG